MDFEPQIPYEPDLTEVPAYTSPDWDVLKSTPPDPEKDYKTVRRLQYLSESKRQAVKARGYVTPITVLILTNGMTTEKQIATTRASLAYMDYDYVVARVIPTTDLVAVMQALETPWAIWVEAGDTLAPYSGLICAEYIAQHPEKYVVYFDEEKATKDGPVQPFFKPDLSLEWLRSGPYVGRGLLVSKLVFDGFESNALLYPILVAYDTVLRTLEKYGQFSVGHISEVLYASPVGYMEWVTNATMLPTVTTILRNHMARIGLKGRVMPGAVIGTARMRYFHPENPAVDVIVPIRDHNAGLRRLIESLLGKTIYSQYNVILVDLGSKDPVFKEYLTKLVFHHGTRVRVLELQEPIPYAEALNRAVAESSTAYFYVLHPDTTINSSDWLSIQMEYAQCENVAAVGSCLVKPDNSILHAGVILGMSGAAGHLHQKTSRSLPGYFGRLKTPQDLSAVTCPGTLFNRAVFDQLGGFHTDHYEMIFHDVDYFTRAKQQGYRVIWTPYVTHTTDNTAMDTMDPRPPQNRERSIMQSFHHLRSDHLDTLSADPYYSSHLSLTSSQPLIAYWTSLDWSPLQEKTHPRILTFPSDKSGCGFYRMHGPLNAMRERGLAEGFSSDWMIPTVDIRRLRADSVILQRKITDPQLATMEDYRKFNTSTFRVYEMDDLLHDIPPKSIHYGQFPADILERVIKGMLMCDRVVVSTDPLAEAFAAYHPDIVVRKNRLIPRYWKHIQAPRNYGDSIRIGWGGGSSHRGDLEMIAEVIKHFAFRVNWVFFGMVPDLIKPYIGEFHKAVPIAQYPEMMASLKLDLALAPVEDNTFNACKSNLRVLEYGACGYPVITSDVAAYNRDNLPITRVRTTEDWIEAIEEHIQDRDRLYERGVALREAIHQDWFLEGDNVTQWLQAWRP